MPVYLVSYSPAHSPIDYYETNTACIFDLLFSYF